MKRWFSVLVSTAALLFCLFNNHADKPKTEDRQLAIYQAKNATVLVKTVLGYGSGVCVTITNAQGHRVTYIWTVSHVVASLDMIDFETMKMDIPSVQVYLNDGRSADAEIIALTMGEGQPELALLRVKTLDWTTNTTHFLHGAPPMIGTPIFHIGNFYGPDLHHSFSEGYIAYLNRKVDGYSWPFDQVNCSLYPGSSGGGFFEEDGECIGLADMRDEETIGILIPSRQIEAWARAHKVPEAFPSDSLQPGHR